jgi:competence protein ComEC
VLGVVAAAVAPLALPVAQVLGVLAGLPTGWLVLVSRVGADVPAASIGWPRGLAGIAAVVGVAIAVVALRRRRHARRPAAALFAGVIVGVAAVHAFPSSWPPRDWAIVICDIGQGDAIVISVGRAEAVVVDVGPDPHTVDACLRTLGVRRVPLVLLTHFHADHVEGLPGVLHGRAVGEIDVGPLHEPAEEQGRVADWAAHAAVPVHAVTPGEVRSVGSLQWEVLAPAHEFHGTNSDPNNSSIVVRVALPGFTALLTGDVEPPAQQQLLDDGAVLSADFLKIPHHGSSHQVAEFLTAAHARLAAASVGAGNPYGHPNAGTLDIVRRAGAQVFRTDRDGGVAILMRAGRLIAVAQRGPGDPPLPVAATAPSARRVTMAVCLPRPTRRRSRSL